MPRPKKVLEQVHETAVEAVVEPIEQGSEDSVIERVVSKLQKVVTIKKQLSEKQQAHLDSLAKKKKGRVSKLSFDRKNILPLTCIPLKILQRLIRSITYSN